MNWNRAEQLLEKYYAGQTSTEEEQEIKHLLSLTGLPPKLQQEQALFNKMQEAGNEETTLTDDELFSRLDSQLAEEKPKAKIIQLPVSYYLLKVRTSGSAFFQDPEVRKKVGCGPFLKVIYRYS